MTEVDVSLVMIINWYNYHQKLCIQICEHPKQVGGTRQMDETAKSNPEHIPPEKSVL
jgi:hypothetical protein